MCPKIPSEEQGTVVERARREGGREGLLRWVLFRIRTIWNGKEFADQ